ncbi:MAG TPA: DNA polymerase Y family protein [Roseomonas sp.]|nr:DNA polymerase Y family protein [Roseomonas sp.]
MTALPRRFLALHLPSLSTDRLRRAEPGLPRDRPLATWAQSASRRLLVAVDAAAEATGVRRGQALADAQAICPGLLLRPAAPEADAALLHALALRGRRYTPLAATDPPDGLLLDVTGCAHLFGGEAALLREARAWLRAEGIAARGAVAGAGAAAAALARARRDDPVVISGAEEEVAKPLPIGPALRLPEAMLADLARLGLHRVDDLLRQPRAPLARRFGALLLERLDAVAGRRAIPLRPALPPPDLCVSRALLEPVVTRGGIEAVLDRLLDDLCDRLRMAGLGARRLVLTAERVDGAVQEVAVGTGLPVRGPVHLRRLFAEKLGRLEPDLGFERMALAAWASDPLPMGRQTGLGPGAESAAEAREALAQLLDRLSQRLRVHRVAPLASHWPEHMLAALGPHAEVPPPPPGWPLYPAPVLRLRRPAPLAAEDSLARVPWRGAEQPVLRAEGPLRLAPEWWRSAAGVPERDYHRVELASGERLWLCRAAGGWWLHGHLP